MSRILVVEDSPVDQLMVQRLLVRPGWVTQIAADGKEALKLIDKVQPDIVITDIVMPVMDGLELVREIRKAKPFLPIVLITSEGNDDIAVEAIRSGATSYSPKSLLQADLARTVEQVLEMSRRMRYTHDAALFPTPSARAFVVDSKLSRIGPLIENMQNNMPEWSQRDRLQIGMALDEALVNAMHHGNLEVNSELKIEDESNYYNLIDKRLELLPYKDRRVRIEIEYSEKHICIQISDEGPGFDPSTIPDPTTPENLHRICGRGLFLIRNFMDQVAHNAIGNQITMTKLLSLIHI